MITKQKIEEDDNLEDIFNTKSKVEYTVYAEKSIEAVEVGMSI